MLGRDRSLLSQSAQKANQLVVDSGPKGGEVPEETLAEVVLVLYLHHLHRSQLLAGIGLARWLSIAHRS